MTAASVCVVMDHLQCGHGVENAEPSRATMKQREALGVLPVAKNCEGEKPNVHNCVRCSRAVHPLQLLPGALEIVGGKAFAEPCVDTG